VACPHARLALYPHRETAWGVTGSAYAIPMPARLDDGDIVTPTSGGHHRRGQDHDDRLLADYELDAEPLPRPGDRQVVIDSAGTPIALIEIAGVRVVRVGDIDLPHAVGEGEGYASVAEWRSGHERFWHSRDYRDYRGDLAFTVNDDTLAVAQRFRLLPDDHQDLESLLQRIREADADRRQ
jgi:uncharacterized protein YhfF